MKALLIFPILFLAIAPLSAADAPPANAVPLAKSSAEQVRMVRGIIERLGLGIATPNEAREMLTLKGGSEVAF